MSLASAPPPAPAAALDSIFKPRSVAIVGATPRKGSIGHTVLHNIMSSDFAGIVYPVHPTASFIHSIKAYPTVSAIPDPVDLAVIIVPWKHVTAIAEECGRKGVRGLIVISAGFREIGPEGARREEELLAVVRRHGMRMIGPNCLGVINATPEVSLNATFAPTRSIDGKVAFMSQSGAFGVSIMQQMEWRRIGLSYFVSIGNSADVKANELLAYWENDPSVELIATYMESFGDPRAFFTIAKRTAKRKPILIVKAGRTPAGQRAASSHTGALSGADVTTDAFLRQCGAIRVSTIEEMMALLMAFSRAPLPRGKRVAVLTNSGGPGIMATDALVISGLEMAQLSEQTIKKVREIVPPEATVSNPIDLTAWGGPEAYRTILPWLCQDPNIDVVLALFVPPLMVPPAEVARAIAEAQRGYEKPILGVVMAEDSSYRNLPKEVPNCPPIYPFPEMAVKACTAMVHHCQWRRRPEGEIRAFDVRTEEARAILAPYVAQGGGYLPTVECMRILDCYGLPTAPLIETQGPDEALAAAQKLGYPVAFKVAGRKIIHKSDVGGIVLNITNDLELQGAYAQVKRAMERAGLDPAEEAGAVQRMAKGGREVILGMAADPKMGPAIVFGQGGRYVEVLKDITTWMPPLSDVDADELIRSIRGYPLLAGVRGEESVALDYLRECLLRFSQLVMELPEIAEMDLNPFILNPRPEDCTVVDVRIRVERGD